MANIDPEVSKLKFEQEVDRLIEQQSALQDRGIYLVGSPVFPTIELLYVPRNPTQIAVQAIQSSTIILPPGAAAFAVADIPSISARAFKVRFNLTDYDLRAPSLEFLDPWTNEYLPYATMFRAQEYEKTRKAHLVLLDDHPNTHHPFLCLRGVREYHEHPQHSGDEWLLYRKEMSLFSIAISVWRVSVDLIRPLIIPQPNGLQVQWNVEAKL